MRTCDLSAPTPGVLPIWSVLETAEDALVASGSDPLIDSTELDDKKTVFLAPVRKERADAASTKKRWVFSRPEYLVSLKKCVQKTKCPSVMPYQMRHSGPGRSSKEEAQKRGRWPQMRSRMRYDRRATLATEWAKVPAITREACESCVARLEEVTLPRRLRS